MFIFYSGNIIPFLQLRNYSHKNIITLMIKILQVLLHLNVSPLMLPHSKILLPFGNRTDTACKRQQQ